SCSLNASMAAISAGAEPALSSITETRYCISDRLPWLGGAPRGRPLTPATNNSAPIRHRLPDILQRPSGTGEPGMKPQRPRAEDDRVWRGGVRTVSLQLTGLPPGRPRCGEKVRALAQACSRTLVALPGSGRLRHRGGT